MNKTNLSIFAIILLAISISTTTWSSLVTVPGPNVNQLLPNDLADNDYFGFNSDLDNDTLVVGVPYQDDGVSDSGTVYIFERNQDGGADDWGLVKKITPNVASMGLHFGYDVAISGDKIIVGVPGDDELANNGGAAYIYYRNQGGMDNWGEITKIMSGDIAPSSDRFGNAVDIDGDVAVVGCQLCEQYFGNIPYSNAGLTFVFARNQGGMDSWNEVAQLERTAYAANDTFGHAVAIDNDRIVAGAPHHQNAWGVDAGSAYTFERNEDGEDAWGLKKILTAGSEQNGTNALFGSAVAIQNDHIVIGAPNADINGTADTGATYIFERNEGIFPGWNQVTALTTETPTQDDEFGKSVAISFDQILVGAPNGPQNNEANASGKAYLFKRNEDGKDNWGLAETFTSLDPQDNDQFGQALAMDGERIMINAPRFDDDGGTNNGAIFSFLHTGNGWKFIKPIYANDAADNDSFSIGLDIDGDVLVVGNRPSNETADAAYVFIRNDEDPDQWAFLKKLQPSDPENDSGFGEQNAINGDLIAVAAHKKDFGNIADVGAVYLFERNQDGQDTWGEVKKIVIPNPAQKADAAFGWDIAFDGDHLIVGAPDENDQFNEQGFAYVYGRNQGGPDNWGLVTTLSSSEPAASARFGYNIEMDNNTAAIAEHAGNNTIEIFERNQGGINNWGSVAIADDPNMGGNFGYGMSLDNNILAVGDTGDTINNTKDGAVYLFYRNEGGTDNWNLKQTVQPNNSYEDQKFGIFVELKDNHLIVPEFVSDQVIYEFKRNQGGPDNWGQTTHIINLPPGLVTQVSFGYPAAKSDNTLVLGAPEVNVQGQNAGAAYIYRLDTLIDLEITKTDSIDPVEAGNEFDYIITVTNLDPTLEVTDVIVEDQLPIQVSFVNADPSQGQCNFNDPVLTCDLGTTAATESATITVTVLAVNPGVALNQANVYSEAFDDPNTNNNFVEEPTTINPANVDVELTVVESADPVVKPNTFTYTVTATNLGSQQATGIEIDLSTLTLPAGVTVDNITPSAGNYNAQTWTLGTLPSQTSETLDITLIVDETTESGIDIIECQVELSAINEPDAIENNNTASEATSVTDSEIFSDGFES